MLSSHGFFFLFASLMSDICFYSFFLDIGLHNSSLSVANMALLSRQVLGSVYGNDLGSQPILDVSVNRDNAQLGMVVS